MNTLFGTKNIKAILFASIGLTFATLFPNASYADNTTANSMRNLEESTHSSITQDALNRGITYQGILDEIALFWQKITGGSGGDKTLVPAPYNKVVELYQNDDSWTQFMLEKNIAELPKFYNDQSILATFPYDESQNIVGVDNIAALFANNIFSLSGDLKLTTTPVARVVSQDVGLIIKQWNVDNNSRSFEGMSIQLLTYNDNDHQWSRLIDLEANNITKPAEFNTTQGDIDNDNSAFDYLADRMLSSMENTKQVKVNLDSPMTAVTYDDSEASITTIAVIPHEDYGLLIARVVNGQGQYLTFNAVKHTEDGWEVVIHARTALSTTN
ncbi:MAG: hypothetical protein KAG53_01805 [Endozoicomonadaceae bacterium]|nr:hypothetical protein [Endozoicomonadaceae bacterium]